MGDYPPSADLWPPRGRYFARWPVYDRAGREVGYTWQHVPDLSVHFTVDDPYGVRDPETPPPV